MFHIATVNRPTQTRSPVMPHPGSVVLRVLMKLTRKPCAMRLSSRPNLHGKSSEDSSNVARNWTFSCTHVLCSSIVAPSGHRTAVIRQLSPTSSDPVGQAATGGVGAVSVGLHRGHRASSLRHVPSSAAVEPDGHPVASQMHRTDPVPSSAGLARLDPSGHSGAVSITQNSLPSASFLSDEPAWHTRFVYTQVSPWRSEPTGQADSLVEP
jgi:hypothetical protein